MDKPIRVLIGKPGLDGHDVGAKLVSRALMSAGMEIIYTGLRQSPESIVKAALEEGVDVLGLSVLSGAHIPLCLKVREEMKAQGLIDVVWILGGNIPKRDRQKLFEIGVHGVFPTGSAFSKMVDFIREKVKQ